MSTPSIQTLITQAQQVLNLKSSNEIRATLAAILANANVGTPLNPNLTTQQLWDEFYEIVRQPSDDIMSIITDQMMRMVFSPPAPGGAGADKQVIFNDGGVLAGDTKFLWDKNANRLDVDGPVVITGDLTVDTSTLKVDSALNKVGVNVATLTGLQTFNVAGDVGITSDLVLKNSGGTAQGYIFGSSGLNYRVVASNPHVWQEGGTDLMRLNSTGLGVGASPSYQLHVAKSQASQTAIYVDNQQNNAAASSALTLSAYGGFWNLSVPHSATFVNPLIFKFGSTEMMRMTSVGDIVLAGGNTSANGVGITFPATQVASSDANTLDDYEEGTWTPVVADASTGGNVGTATINSATYTKIGRQVSIQCDLRSITTTGMTGGNKLFIRGLPFASVKGGNGNFYTYRVGRNASTVSSEVSVEQGVSYAFLSLFTASSANTNLSILVSDIVSGTSELALSVTYTV